jgi:hypothetical protein
MTIPDGDRVLLSRLVGTWEGTLLIRSAAGAPSRRLCGTSENRWVLGGRFVEMTLRAKEIADAWSAVFFVGHDRGARRHVLVSLDSGDHRVTMRLGDWTGHPDHIVLTSEHGRARCEVTSADVLKVQLVEHAGPGEEFIRFAGDYRRASPETSPRGVSEARERRFVIA